ncbi:MAG TPA: hypothetical protein VF175_12890 [Lacipirellula sp.]
MWVLVLLLLGVLGLLYMSLTLAFYGPLVAAGIMDWVGPGTPIAQLSVLFVVLGFVGSVGFLVELVHENRRYRGFKALALAAFAAMFALTAVLGIPV